MVLDTPEQISNYRMAVVIRSIELYLKTKIKMTRNATPANMRTWASEYTGKKYARSSKGLNQALIDLKEFPLRSVYE